MPFWLLKVYAWCKKNWAIVLAVIAALVYIFVYRRSDYSLSDALNEINKAHDEEIKKIVEAQEDLKKKKDENQKVLDDRLKKIDQDKTDGTKALEDSKEEQIKKILSENGDLDELAKQLEKTLSGTK